MSFETIYIYRTLPIINGFVQIPPNNEEDKARVSVEDALDEIVGAELVGGVLRLPAVAADTWYDYNPIANVNSDTSDDVDLSDDSSGSGGDGVGVQQVETTTIVGTITTAGNATVTVTAAGMSNSPKAVSVAVAFDAGTQQVETTTVTGGPTDQGGFFDVTVTAAGMPNSPKAVRAIISEGDTAAVAAGRCRTALGADSDVSGFFTIGGSDANIVLTRKLVAGLAPANDATMNIALSFPDIGGGGVSGLDADPTSDNTTAGVAGTGGDSAATVAGKIRTALTNDADVSAFFTVSGSGANVVLTAKTAAANDATMNIAYTNGTCAGLTPDATSDDTTAGVAP